MRLLRRRDLRLVLAAHALSTLGDALALLALAIRLHDTSHTGWSVAGLLLCAILPTLLLTPVTGLVVDRVETVRVLVVVAVAQAGVAVAMAFATATPVMLVLAFGLGTGAAFNRPALFALLPRTVGAEDLTRASALFQLAQYGGTAVGAAAGGLLTSSLGTRGALLLDAATFVVFAAAGAALRVRRAPEGGGDWRAALPRRDGELRRGLAYVTGDRVLRATIALIGALVLLGGMTTVAEVFLAKDALRAGNAGYGALGAAWTLGIVAGTGLLGARLPDARLPAALFASAGLAGLATAAAGTAPGIAVAVVAYVVGGAGNGVAMVAARSLLAHRVPDELRGRAYAAFGGVMSSAELASMGAGGLVVSLAGPRRTLVVDGLASATVAVLAGLAAARRRARPAPTLARRRLPRPARSGARPPGPLPAGGREGQADRERHRGQVGPGAGVPGDRLGGLGAEHAEAVDRDRGAGGPGRGDEPLRPRAVVEVE